MKYMLFSSAAALLCVSPLTAQVSSPDRPVTDPHTITSPKNPLARQVPLDDISASSGVTSAAWSADGRQVFVTTNITGRFNIWRTDTAGSWPVRLTKSEEAQTGLAVSRDGKNVFFEQDTGGNEYSDIYRVPAIGGAVINLTSTDDRLETGMLVNPARDLIALTTKLKSKGQSNIAIMDSAGAVRNLTNEQDPQFGWSSVAWSNDGNTLIANRTNVDQTFGEVWKIEMGSGVSTRILSKADTVYQATDLSPDGNSIAISSNEDGQMKAMIYNLSDKSWQKLQPTVWEQRTGNFTQDGKTLFYGTNADARISLDAVDIATGKETTLNTGPGFNSLMGKKPLSPDGKHLIVYHSGANTPGNLFVYNIQNDEMRPITQLAIASLSSDALPKSEVVTYKSFDDTLISAIITIPPNLPKSATHPAIVLPHGGPTSQSRDGYSRYATAFASRGYFVIQPNFRGSTGYGKEFQTANFQDLGGGDLKDTVAAKDFLVKTGYVDPDKVGIFGGSYGGFMTLMAIGRTPDEFAAAVQWFGIINWRTMYRDQDELLKAYQRSLLGTPEDNPDVYDAASPLTYINAAKAPLLTIQGENDIRVPKGQAQEVHDILKAKGNIVETIYYPDEGHGFRKRENQIDSLARTIGWFDKYLKGTGE